MMKNNNVSQFDTYENFNIPENWERKKIKHLFFIGRGRVISQEEVSSEEKYPVFSSQTQNNGCLGYISTFDYNCTQLTWTTDGANAGTVFIREGKHNCTNVCGTLLPRTNSISIPFASFSLNYFCQFHKRPDTNGAKIMNNEMAEIAIILPETKKQIAIAKFLTYEEEKTNNLIQKQLQLIELLKEKRQAVISHAVTKGLNPDAPMKNSGVEWSKTIPLHWGKCRLRWLSEIYSGGTPSKEITSYWENGVIPWINSGAVNHQYITEPTTYISTTAYKNSSAKWIPKDSLVIALAGQGKTKGTVALLGIDTTCNQSLAAIKINNKELSKYLFWWLKVNYENIRNISGGDLREGLNLDLLGSIQCPIPGKEEKSRISLFLDDETTRIDILIQKQLQQIDLLKERRTALIAAAVTGKIALRDWTPPASSSEESLTTEEATA